jgi:hypothetical protein
LAFQEATKPVELRLSPDHGKGQPRVSTEAGRRTPWHRRFWPYHFRRHQARHWVPERRRKREKANYVKVRFDAVLGEDAQSVFAAHKISALQSVNWRTQMSGIQIPEVASGREPLVIVGAIAGG